MRAAVEKRSWSFRFASDALKDDSDLARCAVSWNALNLGAASVRLRSDREVGAEAVQRNEWAFIFASEDLKRDVGFICELAKAAPFVLNFVDSATRAVAKRQ